jgi:Fe-S-cluster-containing hydrogenase component 2
MFRSVTAAITFDAYYQTLCVLVCPVDIFAITMNNPVNSLVFLLERIRKHTHSPDRPTENRQRWCRGMDSTAVAAAATH